jgi:hypothetical protein
VEGDVGNVEFVVPDKETQIVEEEQELSPGRVFWK